jgi:hypothetical protein
MAASAAASAELGWLRVRGGGEAGKEQHGGVLRMIWGVEAKRVHGGWAFNSGVCLRGRTTGGRHERWWRVPVVRSASTAAWR